MELLGWGPNPIWLVSLEEEGTAGMCPHRHKVMWELSKKVAICKLGREASEDTKPARYLSLDFYAPELWKNKFL